MIKNNTETGITFFQQLVPTSLIFLTLVVGQAWPSPSYDIFPEIPICLVFYWTLYKPKILNPLMLFLLSLSGDAFEGYYLGITALLWFSLYLFTLSQRWFLYNKPFSTVWFGFALIQIFVFLLHWGVFYLEAQHAIPVLPIVFSYFMTVIAYPLVCGVMTIIHRYVHV